MRVRVTSRQLSLLDDPGTLLQEPKTYQSYLLSQQKYNNIHHEVRRRIRRSFELYRCLHLAGM